MRLARIFLWYDNHMLIVITGPTGSGKTAIALKLADFYKAPIINADAFQIYDEMNIGTAKIEKDSEEYRKHYLLDIVKPNQTYSVKEYQDDFRKCYLALKTSLFAVALAYISKRLSMITLLKRKKKRMFLI